MSGFSHFARNALELEREIVKRGIVIGIDWDDRARLRELAREALSCTPMRQSAQVGVLTSGGPVWKAFGRALYEESERLRLAREDEAGS